MLAWNGLHHWYRAGAPPDYCWYVEEKLDGSPLSVRGTEFRGGRDRVPTASVFDPAITALRRLELPTHLQYFGEAFRCSRHNYTDYDRVPRHYFAVYEIYDHDAARWLTRAEREAECAARGLEPVALLYQNIDPACDPETKVAELIAAIEAGTLTSALGGQPEGVVVKHDATPGIVDPTSPTYTYRYKRERSTFTERTPFSDWHGPFDRDLSNFVQALGRSFATEARRRKAEFRLRDRGEEATPYAIVRELDADFDKEYRDEITNYLWNELAPYIRYHARATLVPDA